MQDKLANGINKIIAEFKKESGEDAKLEDGDELVGVFGDCVIIISLENKEMKVKVILGEPYTFNEKIFEE